MYTFYDLTIECIHSTTFYILYNIYKHDIIVMEINFGISLLNYFVNIYPHLSEYRDIV